jgi:hypothetical protein
MHIIDLFEKEQLNPALLTFDEYYQIVGQNGKWHPDTAYERGASIAGLGEYIKKSNYTKLIKTIKINGVKLEIRQRPEPLRNRMKPYSKDYTFAIFDDNDQCVATLQDEWGCVLYIVAQEYRGFGLGPILGKIAWELEPTKTSGGFTSAGYRTFQKVYREMVRNAMKSGLYTKMVQSGKMSVKRAKEIINSAKVDIRQTKSTANYATHDPKDWMLYVGDNDCVLYDKKLKDIYKNTGNDTDEYWIEKMVLGVCLVRVPHGKGILVQFGGDNDKIKRMMMTYALSYCASEGVPFYVDPEDVKYVDPRFGKVSEHSDYTSGMKRFPVKILDTINFDDFKKHEQMFRKSFDHYQEFHQRLLELAYSKFRQIDYDKNNN